MFQATEDGEGFDEFLKSIGINFDNENTIEAFTRRFNELSMALKIANGDFENQEMGAKQSSTALRVAAGATRRLNQELEQQRLALENASRASLEYLDYLESIGASVGRSVFEPLDREQGTDYVGDFFKGVQEAVRKEQARLKLETMGASEGLIDSILGAQGWEVVFKKIVSDGITGLKRLQEQFSQTADGIDEITSALEKAEKAQQALRDAAQKMIDENIDGLQKTADEAARALQQATDAADEFRRWTLNNLTTLEIFPDIEQQLGKFEQAIVDSISSMQDGLTQAFRSGVILESDFSRLQLWVNTETEALQTIGRRRDELANRFSLSESLISEYQKAIAGSLKLTTILGRLKDETEDVTVTKVTQGVVYLGETLREFGVTVTRSYEETITKVQDKTSGLLQGFRDMAQKSRDFATNLQRLKALGLDPMLFNQLIDAGVEAGGETAQALVDGGSDTILEINSIFDEINKLGAELGLDVGQTMYDAGKDMTYGLLEGIRSDQQALYDQATEMAKKFSEAFKADLNIAIDAPVKVAERVVESAQAAVESAKTANLGALTELNGLIANAYAALEKPLSSAYRAGIENKLGAFEAFQQDLLSGQVQSLGGLTRGMSSESVKDLLLGTGGSNVTNYYVTVEANTRAQGAKAGEAFAEAQAKLAQTSSTYATLGA